MPTPYIPHATADSHPTFDDPLAKDAEHISLLQLSRELLLPSGFETVDNGLLRPDKVRTLATLAYRPVLESAPWV